MTPNQKSLRVELGYCRYLYSPIAEKGYSRQSISSVANGYTLGPGRAHSRVPSGMERFRNILWSRIKMQGAPSVAGMEEVVPKAMAASLEKRGPGRARGGGGGDRATAVRIIQRFRPTRL